nr:reverse transcriptase domain-containing protein [Tanacetum cinerariifolium]
MVQWTKEADEDFWRMKECLDSLPTMVIPTKGETLTIKQGSKKRRSQKKKPKSENAWKLFTDGASSSDDSGVGLMVVSPEGKEYTYALRFEFKTTNNEAKYEALLEGLRIAKEMEIRELIIFVDS